MFNESWRDGTILALGVQETIEDNIFPAHLSPSKTHRGLTAAMSGPLIARGVRAASKMKSCSFSNSTSSLQASGESSMARQIEL